MVKVTIPQLINIETAILIYYNRLELATKDIYELFGDISKSRAQKLKKLAKAKMIELNTPAYGLHTVNTKAAFEAWGIDIKDLEQRRNKLKELGLGTKNSFRIQLPDLTKYYKIESDLRQAEERSS